MSRQSTLFSFFSPRSQKKDEKDDGDDRKPSDEIPSSSSSTPGNVPVLPRAPMVRRSKSYPDIKVRRNIRGLFRSQSDGNLDKMKIDSRPIPSGEVAGPSGMPSCGCSSPLKRPHPRGDDDGKFNKRCYAIERVHEGNTFFIVDMFVLFFIQMK